MNGDSGNQKQPASAGLRLSASLVAGIASAVVLVLIGLSRYAALGAWDIAALVYISWIWITVHEADADRTKHLATRENPGRAVADVLLLIASVASLLAVLSLLIKAADASGIEKTIDVTLGLASVIISWLTVHTVYMLRYASQYYSHPEGGVDFSDEPPRYSDFAYLSFTLGMTFQVSDTGLVTKEFRATVLRHVLLSYVFGTVIIAITINTVASLTK